MKSQYRIWNRKTSSYDQTVWLYQNGHIGAAAGVSTNEEDYLVELATDRKDRDGVRIYEHDLVEVSPPLGVPVNKEKSAIYLVSRDEAGFRYKTRTPIMSFCGWLEGTVHTYKVVGNIHQDLAAHLI